MRFDVVIVNYHSDERLDPLLTLARGFFLTATIYVVNNSPESPVPARLTAATDIVYIENDHNVGFATAVNQAIRHGKNDAIVLLNPDITGVTGNVQKISDAFEADERLAAVAVRLMNTDGTLQHSCRRKPEFLDLLIDNFGTVERLFPGWQRIKRFRMLDWDHDEVRHVDAACGAFLVLRRSAMQAIGLFDERYFVYWEETDWLLRAQHLGWRTLFVPDIEAIHVGGASSARSVDLSVLLVESQLRFTRARFGRKGEWTLRFALLGIDGSRYLRSRVAMALGRTPEMPTSLVSQRLRLYVRGAPERP